ncbi:hypothetical protein QAD02_017880 [Eretmocerus hayati]|uniref:Uncharacterized protein n=1 Tax=Eretmocerus hayati TaxID=131215 RepID=A0ACC2PF68_9HYME|nr:hypothetical protein QAD02_017880 [Eretmocerus hayati]
MQTRQTATHVQLFEKVLKAYDIAIDAETGIQTTFAEMEENSIRCALWMQKQGIGDGDVVTIITHNQLDAYIPCIASFIVGAIYNPWHHEVSMKTARYLMNMTRPKVIFACESALDVMKESSDMEKVPARIIVFGKAAGFESLNDIMKLQTKHEIKNFEPQPISNLDGIAMILFSSGTTGMPKGVAHSHKALLRVVTDFVIVPSRSSTSLWYSPLYWISGTICMLRSIITRCTRILHTDFDPEETCRIIEKYQVNWFFIIPTMCAHLSKSKVLSRYQCQSLEYLITGGSKQSREVLEDLRNSLTHTFILQAYGMTEIGGAITAPTRKSKNIESVGVVVPNTQIKIVDLVDGKTLGPDQEGEICAKSPTMMVCYYKNPTATRDTIDHEGWIHTGDKGYYTSNGELFIIDRLKEVMIFRGHRISPSEIEDLLMTHPAIMEVAVVPVPHDVDVEHPMAFVKKCVGGEVTEEELVKLSSQLGEYKKLRAGVEFIDSVPHTATGKIDRKTLREMAKAYIR